MFNAGKDAWAFFFGENPSSFRQTLFSFLVPLARCALFMLFTLLLCSCGKDSGGWKKKPPHIPNDDPSIPAALSGVDHWPRLPVAMLFDAALAPGQVASIKAAMATWESATGRRLFQDGGSDVVTDRSEAGFRQILSEVKSGFYLVKDWKVTNRGRGIIAVTECKNSLAAGGSLSPRIASAQVFLNVENYGWVDSLALGTSVVDTQSVVLHELGHALGLDHVSVLDDPESIMNPSMETGVGNARRRLSRGDVKRIQAVYGCTGAACDLGSRSSP